MHCGNCGSTTVEVRPCYIRAGPTARLRGDAWVCQCCAQKLAARFRESDFTPWLGHQCDRCGSTATFDGPIVGLLEGIVCDQCESPIGADRGVWLCDTCYDLDHFGHRQKQLQPILDRLSRL